MKHPILNRYGFQAAGAVTTKDVQAWRAGARRRLGRWRYPGGEWNGDGNGQRNGFQRTPSGIQGKVIGRWSSLRPLYGN